MARKIDIEEARCEMIEFTLNELVISFNQELRAKYGNYDHFAGWIKKGLILGKLLGYVRWN